MVPNPELPTSLQNFTSIMANINQQVQPGQKTSAQYPSQTQSTQERTSTTQKQSSGNNVVGVHYKIGRKIGEGSFGIIYEGAFGIT
jgi:hypothetical protein